MRIAIIVAALMLAVSASAQNFVVPVPQVVSGGQAPKSDKSVKSRTIVVADDSNALALAAPASVSNSFIPQFDPSIDVGAATDGTFIVATDELGAVNIYSMNGTLLKSITVTDTICHSGNPLPVCSGHGGFDDTRIIYDPGAHRWVISGLWAFPPAGTSPQAVVLASKSSDPQGGWWYHQFPACGAFDTWDGSDQPHLGFNGQWIVITSACSCQGGVNGTGLSVLNKTNLYVGGGLTSSTLFQFADGFTGGPFCGGLGPGGRDQPVRTYSAVGNREYLAAAYYALDGTGTANVIYGYVDGNVFAPVYHPSVETVNIGVTSTSGGGGGQVIPHVATPDCTNCMVSDTNGWIHSAGTWQLSNGDTYVISSHVAGATALPNETELINVALDTRTGAATTLVMQGGIAGSGPLASEIALPLANSTDDAVIGYDHSRGDFIAGVKDIVWHIPTNAVVSINVLQQGVYVPQFSNCSGQGRWVDFLDALQPIPSSGNLLIGGSVGLLLTSPVVSECANYYATISVP